MTLRVAVAGAWSGHIGTSFSSLEIMSWLFLNEMRDLDKGDKAGPVTIADVNLKFILDVVSRIKVGDKGKAYVVDGSGHLVADPDIGLVLRKTDLSNLPQVQWALRKDAEESFALVARDSSDAPVLTAYASIEPLGWKVFVEQPESADPAATAAASMRVRQTGMAITPPGVS